MSRTPRLQLLPAGTRQRVAEWGIRMTHTHASERHVSAEHREMELDIFRSCMDLLQVGQRSVRDVVDDDPRLDRHQRRAIASGGQGRSPSGGRGYSQPGRITMPVAPEAVDERRGDEDGDAEVHRRGHRRRQRSSGHHDGRGRSRRSPSPRAQALDPDRLEEEREGEREEELEEEAEGGGLHDYRDKLGRRLYRKRIRRSDKEAKQGKNLKKSTRLPSEYPESEQVDGDMGEYLGDAVEILDAELPRDQEEKDAKEKKRKDKKKDKKDKERKEMVEKDKEGRKDKTEKHRDADHKQPKKERKDKRRRDDSRQVSEQSLWTVTYGTAQLVEFGAETYPKHFIREQRGRSLKRLRDQPP